MKIKDLEEIKEQISEIKSISDKLDYVTSTAINQRLIKITPFINDELNRLNLAGVEINGPKILIFTNRDAKNEKLTVQEYMNKKLNELTVADYKIIDFGKMDEEFEDDNTRTIYFFIKYTS